MVRFFGGYVGSSPEAVESRLVGLHANGKKLKIEEPCKWSVNRMDNEPHG